MTSKLIFLFLVLSFEDHFRFLMLFSNKYLNINKIKILNLNIVKKEKAVKSQLKVSKSDSATLSLVIVSWSLLQLFLVYLHSYFRFTLQFLLVTFLKGLFLLAHLLFFTCFGSLFF